MLSVSALAALEVPPTERVKAPASAPTSAIRVLSSSSTSGNGLAESAASCAASGLGFAPTPDGDALTSPWVARLSFLSPSGELAGAFELAADGAAGVAGFCTGDLAAAGLGAATVGALGATAGLGTEGREPGAGIFFTSAR